MKIVGVCVLLVALTCVQGCHWPYGKRKKRDTSAGLQSFFTGCIINEINQNVDYAVEFVVDDSSWFAINNALNCVNDFGSDTPNCWNDNLEQYFDSSSPFLTASQACVNIYSNSQGKKKKRSIPDGIPSSFSGKNERQIIREYSECLSEAEEGRSDRNYLLLTEFVRDETIFGCESCLGGCRNNQLIEGYDSALIPPQWPCMFLQQTKNTSTLRRPIETCNQEYFPEPCWEKWGEWSSCSEGCSGKQTRTRTCLSQLQKGEPLLNIWCVGSDTETRACCGEWGEWQGWSKCGSNCRRSRTRSCFGRLGCPGASEQNQLCFTGECWLRWSDWGAYTDCMGTGQRCFQTRSRNCTRFNTKVDIGICTECLDGDSIERKRCPPSECSTFNWSDWSIFSPCRVRRSGRCGPGTRNRSRQCQRGEQEVDQFRCEGQATESQSCTVRCSPFAK